MNIAILTTGDEVMAGNIADTNAAWLSDKCWLMGHIVILHLAVGDDKNAISDALKYASKKADVIIVSGGLGPTVDDITIESASKFFNLKMVLNEKVWNGIKTFFKKINRECSPNNKRQAMLPQGAIPLENSVGTAPGLRLSHHNVEYFFVPGVPKEMKHIFKDSISPWLKENSETSGYHQKFLKCFGLPEATFDEMIKGVEFKGVNLSFRVSFPEVNIKLVSRMKDQGLAEEAVERAADKIKEILGIYIYAENDVSLEETVGNILKSKGIKLALAESCTGGLIANRITNISGASEYFERGNITYSNASKTELLGVSEDIIKKYGAVSHEVATAMAGGALAKSNAQVSLAVTGVAGPNGGSKEKPVGTVYIAIDGPNGTICKKHLYPRDRLGFKDIVATLALDMLRRYLLGEDIA